jgi:hypothetical protein
MLLLLMIILLEKPLSPIYTNNVNIADIEIMQSTEEEFGLVEENDIVINAEMNNLDDQNSEDYFVANNEDLKDIDEIQKIDDYQAEELIYIGKQPPEGYIEPTHLDKIEKYLNNKEFMDEYNDHFKLYIELKDAFQSNIIFINRNFAIDFEDHEWFKHLPQEGEQYYGIYRWICYAILTYFDGDVPCDFHVTPESIYNIVYPNESTDLYHIFEVQTYGERPLHIRMDQFNKKIRVEEGIKKPD